MNRDRISNLTKTKDGKECIKISQRRKWVTFLRKHLCSFSIKDDEKKSLIHWASNTKVHEKYVQKVIDDVTWRKSEMLNY